MRSTVPRASVAAALGCLATWVQAQSTPSPYPVAVETFSLTPGQGGWTYDADAANASAQLFTHRSSYLSPESPLPLDATRVLINTESGWFNAKTAELSWQATVNLAPVEVQGTRFVQAFTAQAAFRLVSDEFMVPAGAFMDATITGGRLIGELGSDSGLTLELDLSQVTSDFLALADNHGTFTAVSGHLAVRDGLHLTCANPVAGCDGQTQYLASYAMDGWRQGSFSPNLFAAAVPEPGSVGLALLGLAGLAWRRPRQRA
jgi:hypothetical protein